MDLYFLGTGAGMPSKQRNVTSIALSYVDERGGFWLFDCGEATQHRIMHSPLKLSKLEKLFVTHLHGDHIYGIPGLLASRSYHGGETPLALYGPKGIKHWIESTLRISQARLNYPLEIVEIEEGVVLEDDHFAVETARLEHRVESYGYRVREKEKPGRLLIEKLQTLGIPSGPLYGKLKLGLDIDLEDGRKLIAGEFLGLSIPGRTLAILGDTRVCESSLKLAENADVLVHEATFASKLQDLAFKYYHTTATEAAMTAKNAAVQTLIMTHISSRYQGEEEEQLLNEARAIFPNTFLARDFWSYTIPRQKSE